MHDDTPYTLIKIVEAQINGTLSAIDPHAIPAIEHKRVLGIKHDLADARLDTRNYEVSTNPDDRSRHGRHAVARLRHIKETVGHCRQLGLFRPHDAEDITNKLDEIIEQIEGAD
jgi:hypothetical protein